MNSLFRSDVSVFVCLLVFFFSKKQANFGRILILAGFFKTTKMRCKLTLDDCKTPFC